MSREPTNEFAEFIQVHQCIRDREVHSQLQMNLVEHIVAITRRVMKTFGFVYLSPLLYGVAIKTFDFVYLFHFVFMKLPLKLIGYVVLLC